MMITYKALHSQKHINSMHILQMNLVQPSVL